MNMFDSQKEYGLAAERDVAAIFDALGYEATIIDKPNTVDSPGGPKFVTRGHQYDAPDIVLCRAKPFIMRYVQVKRTQTCLWYESHLSWRVGMNYEQYLKYCDANARSRVELLVVYVIDGGLNPKYKNPSPSGKFVQEFSILQKCIEEDKKEPDRMKRMTDINPPLNEKRSADGQVSIINPGDSVEISDKAEKKDRMVYWDLRIFDDLYKWHASSDRKALKTK